jgi:hypothetical protein
MTGPEQKELVRKLRDLVEWMAYDADKDTLRAAAGEIKRAAGMEAAKNDYARIAFERGQEIERLKATATVARDNLRALWHALHMIRDCIEELGPVGALPPEEHLMPEPHHEAEALIAGIQTIVAARSL